MLNETEMAKAIMRALDPNVMKYLLIGEFSETAELVVSTDCEDEEEPQPVKVPVTWHTTKLIMQAIKEQALLNMGAKCSGCGSLFHILTLRDKGHVSCCPERKLVLDGAQDWLSEAMRK